MNSARAVGLVSSSIRQMIGDDATALEIVVSGKSATLNSWPKPRPADRTRALSILRQVEGNPNSPTVPGLS